MTDTLLDEPTFWALAARRADHTPAAPLVIDGLDDRVLTCRQAVDAALALAADLVDAGVRPGDRVSWQLPTGLPAFLLQLALARLGAVQNPLISMFGRAEVEAVLRRVRPAFLVLPVEGAQGLDEVMPDVRRFRLGADGRLKGQPRESASVELPAWPTASDAERWIHVTSGTSAEPKGVCHAERSLLLAGRNLALAMAAGPDDVGAIAYPIAHVGGAMYTVMLLASGASAVLLPRFQPAEVVEVFRRHGVTLAGGSTAHYLALLNEASNARDVAAGTRRLPRLRLLSGGGAPKPPELVARVRDELGCQLAHAYGMTEAPLMVAGRTDHTDEQLAHSDGAAVTGVQVRIVLADGREVDRASGPGLDGEIRVRGPGLFLGYTDPSLHEAAFDADGWFRTGDLGRWRADGHLVVTGRLKDVIIRKGENISAREIEDLLARHPKVGAVAVIGLPDAQRGERVCAVVEPRQAGVHIGFDEMVAWFEAASVMRQKIPEQLEVVDSLPRLSALNKVSKAALRERYRGS